VWPVASGRRAATASHICVHLRSSVDRSLPDEEKGPQIHADERRYEGRKALAPVPPHAGISARRESSWATHASNAEMAVPGFPLAFPVEVPHNPCDGDAAPAMDDLSTTNAKDDTSTPTSTECGAHGVGGNSCWGSSDIDDLVLRDRDANTRARTGLASDGCARKSRSGASRTARAASETRTDCTRACPGMEPRLPALGVIRRAGFMAGCP
jgi:hypothetical protein